MLYRLIEKIENARVHVTAEAINPVFGVYTLRHRGFNQFTFYYDRFVQVWLINGSAGTLNITQRGDCFLSGIITPPARPVGILPFRGRVNYGTFEDWYRNALINPDEGYRLYIFSDTVSYDNNPEYGRTMSVSAALSGRVGEHRDIDTSRLNATLTEVLIPALEGALISVKSINERYLTTDKGSHEQFSLFLNLSVKFDKISALAL